MKKDLKVFLLDFIVSFIDKEDRLPFNGYVEEEDKVGLIDLSVLLEEVGGGWKEGDFFKDSGDKIIERKNELELFILG